jgi:hypothetical protein
MSSEVSFEQRFGQLVDAELNEKLPSLVEYRVGFQVIDKTDDESKAVGIYAFVMNNTWIYIPVFFIDGKLEGFELMYIKQKDLFVPALDNWIAAINEQGVQVLGHALSPSDVQDEALGATPENTNTFISDGTMSKVAAESYNAAVAYGDNSPLEKEAVLKMCDDSKVDMSNIKLPSLSEMLTELPKEAKSLFVTTFLKEPDFANAMFRHYSVDEMEKIATECITHRLPAKKVEGAVTYITNLRSKEAKDLSQQAKGLLVKHGLYIEDHRTNFTQVYQEEVDTSCFQNPNADGIFDVIMSNGTLEKRIIIIPKDISRGDNICRRGSNNMNRKVALIDIDGSSNFEWRHASEIFCKPATGLDVSLTSKQRGGMRGSLRALRDIPEGAHLLFVQGPKHAIKTTLLRRRKDASGGIVVTAEGTTGYTSADPSVTPFSSEMQIEFIEGGKLCIKGDIIYVPADDTRVFVDYPLWMRHRKDSSKGPNGGDIAKLTYGRPDIIRDMAYGDSHMGRVEVQTSAAGNYASVKDANGHTDLLAKEAAAQVLCEGWGVSGADAMRMMKLASQSKGNVSRFLLKTAAPFDIGAYRGSSFIPFMGGPSGRPDQNVDREERQVRQGKPLTGPTSADGTSILPQQAIDKAQEASEAGIREVLDVTVIEQLIDKADISEIRKDYISEMIQGMDSIGRMLFLYYWHNDQFEEKYGRDKMKELKEHLREVFNSTGDLVLFLKEKTTFNPDQTDSIFGNLSEDIATAEV